MLDNDWQKSEHCEETSIAIRAGLPGILRFELVLFKGWPWQNPSLMVHFVG